MNTQMSVLEAGGETAITPMEVVAQNKERADALIQVVNQTNSYQKIGGKNYLMVEAWQLIGRFDNASAVTAWTRPLVEDGGEIGQEARVEIWKNGAMVGGAEMACGYDEFVCRGKEGVAKKNAAKSMSQTRATSKAFRMIYSFVAVLAGYQPTPAEEMPPEQPQRPVQQRKQPEPTHSKAPRELKSIGDLIMQARDGYGAKVLAGDVYEALGVEGPLDLDDNFEGHWARLVEQWGEVPA